MKTFLNITLFVLFEGTFIHSNSFSWIFMTDTHGFMRNRFRKNVFDSLVQHMDNFIILRYLNALYHEKSLFGFLIRLVFVSSERQTSRSRFWFWVVHILHYCLNLNTKKIEKRKKKIVSYIRWIMNEMVQTKLRY